MLSRLSTFSCTKQRLNNYSSRRFATQANAVPSQATVVRYEQHGQPQKVLSLKSEPLPSASNRGVVVQMLYAPINPADLNMVTGSYPITPKLPAVGGSEGLGQVISVGSNVNKLKVGDLVFPLRADMGTWRTHAAWEESDLLPVPLAHGIQEEYLAALSINPATAYRMLTDFVDLKEGDVIIQNGANSMVGMSALQIAASRGIKSINIIRRRSDYTELVERMKNYGAYIVIGDDYVRTAEFRKLISDLPKPKLALNCVGGHTATEMARLLDVGGTLVTYGRMSVKPVTIPTSSLIFNDIKLKGFWLSRWYEQNSVEARAQLMKDLIKLVENGKLRLWIEKHPLENFSTALERAIDTGSRGRKVLLTLKK